MPSSQAPRVTWIARAAQPELPWRNGGGTTREVAAEPTGARARGPFVWRVSIARIASDGPFSAFPGYDRTLWLLAGTGMHLAIGDRSLLVEQTYARVDFPGEATVTARLLGGPTEDLNLMVDRRRVAATAEILRLGGEEERARVAPGEQHLLVVLEGAVRSRAPGHELTLRTGDALVLDDVAGDCDWEVTAEFPSRGPAVALRARFAPCA